MNSIQVFNTKSSSRGDYKTLISISIYLPNHHTDLLYDSAVCSTRSKRQEATIRLIDHLNDFPSFSMKDKDNYYSLVNGLGGVTGINLQISEVPNLILNFSSRQQGHSKRIEAALRIVDHLNRFESIACIGKRFAR
jgi:hypothetical protein